MFDSLLGNSYLSDSFVAQANSLFSVVYLIVIIIIIIVARISASGSRCKHSLYYLIFDLVEALLCLSLSLSTINSSTLSLH